MAVFSYWYCESFHHDSIIARTEEEAIAKRFRIGMDGFAMPVQKFIYYGDIFDLFEHVTGDDGGKNCGIADQIFLLSQDKKKK